MSYLIPKPGKKSDRFRCVAVVYDEFVEYAESAEQVLVTSYLYDGAPKQMQGLKDRDPLGYYSSAPIRECELLLKLTRGRRGYALRQLRERGMVEPRGVWLPNESDYFRPGTYRYRVAEEFMIRGRTIVFGHRNPTKRREDTRETFTPIYGWMVELADDADELMLLAFIVRKYRAADRLTIRLSNGYIRRHTKLSYYAIRKALKRLQAKGLIEIQQQAGEVRQVRILRPLEMLVKEHADRAVHAKRHGNKWDRITYQNTRRRGKPLPATTNVPEDHWTRIYQAYHVPLDW